MIFLACVCYRLKSCIFIEVDVLLTTVTNAPDPLKNCPPKIARFNPEGTGTINLWEFIYCQTKNNPIYGIMPLS